MINVATTKYFNRRYIKFIKKNPEIHPRFKDAVKALATKPHPASLSLRIHKLSGDMKDLWSFSLDSDVRVIFRYQKDGILLVNIGNHDDVY